MPAPLTRVQLFDRLRGGQPQWRPPWTGDEAGFLEACTACGDCIEACPTGLLGKGHAGYPIADFAHAACTFCGRCAEICEAGCFRSASGPAWGLRATISTACVEARGVACRRCTDACEHSAIRFRPRVGGGAIAEVDGRACTGCGACLAPCPVRAISIKYAAEIPA
ncbi:MAG: ferredoxin-type protein NapF [Hyphomicrobiaceae bacterium]|nr:MAG: ferredoxin-type protein NapF [Hyphomicrobiaceae bacterium]